MNTPMFSKVLKSLRMESGMTQTQLAERLFVTRSTINRWENGRATPNITAMSNLKSFCMERDIPFNELESLWLQLKRRGSNGTDL